MRILISTFLYLGMSLFGADKKPVNLISSSGLDYYCQGGVVVDGVAYFTAGDRSRRLGVPHKKDFPAVVAFDTKTFKKLRTYDFEHTYDSSPLVFQKKDGSWLIIAHEHLNSRTVAINRDTGKVEWISESNQPGRLFFGYSYFVRDDGSKLILMACSNGLHAMSSETGKDLWWLKRKSNGGVTPCVDQENGWIYYQCPGELLKIRAADGKVIESTAIKKPFKCISWNTVLINDSYGYYIATYWYGRKEWDSAIRVFDKDLKLVWERTGLPIGTKATLTYADGKLVSGSGNQWNAEYQGNAWKYIAAYAIGSGEVLWKCDLSEHQYVCILNVPYFNGFFYAQTQEPQPVSSKVFRINAENGNLEEMLDYNRSITSCATGIIAHGKLLSGDLHEDRIVVTSIANNSNQNWIGPFGDPQTHQMAVPLRDSVQLVKMKEIARDSQFESSIDNNRYLTPVIGCLDTLMTKGTDQYGSEHSPMFSSIIEMKKQRMPKKAPPLLSGQRKADRAFPGGNLQQDMFTLLAMYHISNLTNNPRYSKAADAYLEFFLRRCASFGNGLFPYGEHAYWDFQKETCTYPTHEDLAFVPREFLDRLWAINPKATEKHIRQLEKHFLEGDQWTWNRHASIDSNKRPTQPAPFPRHAGFYIYQWSFLHSKTSDPHLLALIQKTVKANRTRDRNNLSIFSLGLSLLRANKELLGKDAVGSWNAFGRDCLMPLVRTTKDQPSQGRILAFVPARESPKPTGTYGFWDKVYESSGGYGFVGSEKLSLMCLLAHRLTGSKEHLQYAQAVWETYQRLSPPEDKPITPGKYGGLIALSLDLYDLTKNPKYFLHAKRTADRAIAELYSNSLFRAATGKDYYEAANGVGPLLIELIRLHLVLNRNDYPLPRYYSDT